MDCKLIFKLNDGSKYEGKEEINKVLNQFPKGILEKMKPIFFKALNSTTNWNKSVVTVYQDGKYDVQLNLPKDLPFSLDEIFE